MNVLTYNPDVMTKNTVIPLGRACECRATRIEFEVSSWLSRFPGGEIVLYVKDPNDEAYLATITTENGVASWVLTNTDTQVSGYGSLELALIGANGERKLSAVATTKIDPSLVEAELAERPEYMQPWIERAAEIQAKTAADAKSAATHAAVASTAANNAVEAMNAADVAQEAAEAAREAAEDAAQGAEDCAQEAATQAAAAKEAASLIGQMAPAIVCEASGAVVSLTDALERPVQGLVSAITAAQAGEGTPSPDNVRPLAGWDAVQLYHGAAYDEAAEPVLTAALPETVYGGTLDWTTGLLTITHDVQVLNGTEEWTRTDTGFFQFKPDTTYHSKTASENNEVAHVCSHFKADRYRTYSAAPDNSVHEMNNNRIMVKCTSCATLADWTAYLAAQAAAGTPVTIVWELLPKYHTTAQLDAQQLKTLKEHNAIWSSTGDTAIAYIADTKLYVDRVVAALAASILNA